MGSGFFLGCEVRGAICVAQRKGRVVLDSAALVGLFSSAFLAATVLPVSSEVVLAALLMNEGPPAGLLLAVASLGNTLGSVVNWGLGRFVARFQDRRWFPATPDQMARAQRWYGRYGVWSLLLSWVPVIGDPLTVVAGALRTPFVLFLPIVAIAKTSRYAAILWLLG